jgi:hypothetical protein
VNVSDAQQLAKDLIDETGTPGRWGSARLLRLTGLANRLVYKQVAANDASYFSQWNRLTYPANAESIDLTSADHLNKVPFKLTHVEKLKSDAAVSPSNPATPLPVANPDSLRESVTAHALSAFYDRISLQVRVDEGWLLKLEPIPGAQEILNVRWVPKPRELTLTSDNLLTTETDAASEVRAEEYHDLVVAVLVKLMEATLRSEIPVLTELSRWIDQQIREGNRDRHTFSHLTYADPY